MSEQGIRMLRPFGRHFWLVVAAVLTLAAGMFVAVAVSGSPPTASANHCPGEDIVGGGQQTIDGVTLTVSISGNSVTVTASEPFTGTISIFGGGETQEFAINITEAGGSQTFTFDSQHEISHVCLSGQAAPPPTTDTTDTTTTETETTTTETTDTTTTPTTPTGGQRGVETVVQEQEVPGAVAGEEVVAGAAPGTAAAAPAGQAAPSQLAFTGLSAVPLALLAGGMLALGLGLRRASRRTG